MTKEEKVDKILNKINKIRQRKQKAEYVIIPPEEKEILEKAYKERTGHSLEGVDTCMGLKMNVNESELDKVPDEKIIKL